jgi:Rieske Fe-S protein
MNLISLKTMKKVFAISVAALAAFVATGCNPSGNSSYTQPVIVEQEEITGGVITTSEYEYDAMGNQISEVRSVNGRTVYKIDGYENGYDGSHRTLTRTRTNYGEDGSVVSTHTLVSTFGYSTGRELMETEYKVTDDEGIVIELKETRYNENGLAEIKHTIDKDEVLHRTDYDNGNMSGSAPYYTYMESRNGGGPVKMCYKITLFSINDYGAISPFEYEIWAGWESDTNKGILVEKQSEYEDKQMGYGYEVVKYDPDGNNPVTTKVTKTFEMLTIIL